MARSMDLQLLMWFGWMVRGMEGTGLEAWWEGLPGMSLQNEHTLCELCPM